MIGAGNNRKNLLNWGQYEREREYESKRSGELAWYGAENVARGRRGGQGSLSSYRSEVHLQRQRAKRTVTEIEKPPPKGRLTARIGTRGRSNISVPIRRDFSIGELRN